MQRQPRWPVAALAAPFVSAVLSGSAGAVEVGPVDIGGAVRANLMSKSWETWEPGLARARLELDTVFPDIRFESGGVTAGFQYRYYYYRQTGRDTHFLHHGWIGYDLPNAGQLMAGVTKVPFGLLPFASSNYFFSLAYYVGLEDDYDLGVTYEDASGPWRWQVGYFLGDEGSFHGDSPDSARYSYDVVSDGVTENDEGRQANVWLERGLTIGGLDDAAIGLSLQYARIPNRTTDRTGDQVAAALHARAAVGRWSFKWQSLYYEYNLENPPDQPDDRVIMGAYDSSYEVAARGHIHGIGVAYAIPFGSGVLDTVTLYNDYSVLFKPADGFETSQHNVTGAALDFDGPLLVYVECALGKHNAWIGRDFGTALGPGGRGGWEYRLNINTGLYF